MAQLNQQAANVLCTTYPFFNMAWNALKVPEYYEKAIERYGMQSVTGLMDQYATKTTRRDITYNHMENDRLHPQLLVSAATAAGPGLPVTLTIAASSHVMSGTQDPTQIQMSVMFPDRKWALITAKNSTTPFAHTITVTPFDPNYTIVTYNNEQLTLGISSLVGEGSSQQPGQIKTPGLVFTNGMETVRMDLCVTGQMMAAWNDRMVLVPEGLDRRTGKFTKCWWNTLLGDYYQKFQNSKEMMLLGLEPIVNPSLTGSTYGNLQGFTGLIPSIIAGGNVINTGNFKINDLKVITLRLDTQRACNEFWVNMGNVIFTQMQDEIKAWFPNGAVTYGAFGADGQMAAAKWGFSSIGCYGYTFHMKKLPLFYDPSLWGAPGWTFPGQAIAIPACKTIDMDGDPTSYVQITHLLGCGYERTFDHWVTGGASWIEESRRTNDVDSVNFHFLEQFGIEVFKNNQFFYINKP